ncbi:MAG: class I SAM-dependent methyltransferase [bacterium]|nr:class I SAM-dependent methyltransferase [bacterium]
MSQKAAPRTNTVRLGTHGEDYGNWMSNPVFYVFWGITAAAIILLLLSFLVFHLEILGIIFSIVTVALILFLLWLVWIRHQYAFGGGGMMDKVHQSILSELDYDGKGMVLEVGCGSGALSIRTALIWPETKVIGIDYWGAMYNYSKSLCEKNAQLEGVASRCAFQRGDANKLEFPDETFDAVISNYVYHNITGSDRQTLLLESLQVLKKGGVFALHDAMKPNMYGDMEAFVQKLRDMGYQEVRLVDTSNTIFGSAE